MGEMIISAVAIRRARSLANGYRSPNPPQSPVMDVVHNRELIFLMLTGIALRLSGTILRVKVWESNSIKKINSLHFQKSSMKN